MYKETNYPSRLLEDAVDALSSLPAIGRKGALRLALHLLRQPRENVLHLASTLVSLREDVRYCPECMMITDEGRCSVCSDRTRDKRTICVVESVRDVMSIENTGQYRGVYHVLGGIISPINGIGPSDLTIGRLVERVKALTSGSGQDSSSAESGPASDVEVIFALSGDVEGETTAFYIYRQIESTGVKVSTVARGLGFGDSLEYADELTIGRSILNRQEFRMK